MVERLEGLGRFGLFAAEAMWRVLTPPWEIHEAARHVWLLLYRCALPVVAVVFPAGMVLALQGLQIFDLFGAQRMLSSLISVSTLRELSPVLASVLVAAQGGSSFAAELGAMRIKEELDATAVMAVDPLRVHVAPRLMAAMVATPTLNLLGSIAGIAGGWLVAVMIKGENSGVFMANMWALTHPSDLFGGLFKTFVFGTLIGLVATYYGYNASGGAAGVGRAVNDTVVTAVTAFIVVNYFLTSAMFGVLG
ncbi:MAG TPA: ABC transporter permease [Myxococcota bacterium]|nr:ABC transporter permease [Myxococcota bacterium]